MELFNKLLARLSAFGDKSGWILILIGAVVLGVSDFDMLKMLVKWMSFAFVVGGVTIFMSRVFFPTIRFKEFLPEALKGNIGAGLIVAAVIVFCSISFHSIIYWAK